MTAVTEYDTKYSYYHLSILIFYTQYITCGRLISDI